MNHWTQTVAALVKQLKPLTLTSGIEAQAVDRLEDVLRALNSQDETALRLLMEELRYFWLHVVPWCSELSRKLERVLVDYEEMDGH